MIIMKQTKQLGLAMMAMALLALVSCSKTNKQGRLVPQNASYVMHINGEQLSAKINWDEIKGNESMKEFLSDSTLPAYISKVLQNPTESGIDLKKDMLVYAVIDDMGGYIAFTGTVLNADKFRNFNLDLTEGGFEREEKGVKYISKMPMIVGYDKEKFVYVANLPELNEGRRRGGEEGKASRDVQQTAINIFQLSEDKSLGKNSKFTTLLKDGGDIHIWMNSEELAKGSGVEMVPLVNIEKFTKDNISTATLTFNNGNISLKSRWYASKELMGAFKKNAGKKVDENMVRNLPADNVNFLLALNFKAEAIREVLALTGMEGLISGLLKRQTGVSLDDLVKANKGDILIAGCNLRQERKTVLYGKGAEGDGYSYNKTEMDFLLATSINDKQAFNKLIQAGQDKSRELLGDDEISDSAKDQLPSYASNDKLFVFGNRKATVDNYLAGNGKNTTMLSLIGNKPIGGYADIQSILKGIEPEADADSTDKEMYALTLQFWDNVALSGGDFEDGAMLFEAQINLKDKNTNSLKQLSTYGQKMAALEAAKRKKQEEEWGKLDPITPDQPTAPLPPPPSIYPKKRP